MQLLRGPGCQPQLLLVVPPSGRRGLIPSLFPASSRGIPLLCLLMGPCPGHSPAGTPRTAGFWGQGDAEQRVKVPLLLCAAPTSELLMLHGLWRHSQPKE